MGALRLKRTTDQVLFKFVIFYDTIIYNPPQSEFLALLGDYKLAPFSHYRFI